jgi:putative restriction endonuclease
MLGCHAVQFSFFEQPVEQGATMTDEQVRNAAFAFLEQQTMLHGEVVPHSVLLAGFTFLEQRVPLIGPQGIFKPAILPDMPLSFYTAPPKPGKPVPYHDELGRDGLLYYRYRGTDPTHRDNVGMKLAAQRNAPLIYLFGIVPGEYLPIWPVYIVGHDDLALTFKVAVDDQRFLTGETGHLEQGMREAIIARFVPTRLNQVSFRRRVLRAYRETCSVCRLRHADLLDAAHILPYGDPEGGGSIDNGLALCKLHHAAYDRHILGVNPDCVVEIRRDILEEVDGPMLQHGLKEMAGTRLHVPGPKQLRPRREFLEKRYELFRKAG